MLEKGKFKTRCYYTDYVNHMVRFYLTCPDCLKMDSVKRKVDIENWIAVQGVLHSLTEENRNRIIEIYRLSYNVPEAVMMYCKKTGADEIAVWKLMTKTSSLIAKSRGLV